MRLMTGGPDAINGIGKGNGFRDRAGAKSQRALGVSSRRRWKVKIRRKLAKMVMGLVVVAGLAYAGSSLFAKPAYAMPLCTPSACAEEKQDAEAICQGNGGLWHFDCGIGTLAYYTCGNGLNGNLPCGN